MRVTVTVVSTTMMREDALVDCPESVPVAEILDHLRRLAGVPGNAAAVVDGEPVDGTRAMSPISAGLIHDGSVVSFVAPSAPSTVTGPNTPSGTTTTHELRVVAGPAAGSAYQLRPGANVIGRGATTISVNDPTVSRRHAIVVRSVDGFTVADAGSTNGTFLDGVRVSDAATPMRLGARLQIGGSTLLVATPDGSSRRTTMQPRQFNRAPRLDPPDLKAAAVEIVLPTPPHHPPKPQLPVIATVTPLIAGAALAAIMRRPEYLLFTVVSPLMIAGQWLADRRGGGRTRRRERIAYESDLIRARGELEVAIIADAVRRNVNAPNHTEVDAIGRTPHPRRWERRPGDQDFLLLRLGSGDQLANVRIAGAGADVDSPMVRDVPLTLTLSDVGVLGIVGPTSRTSGVVRALVGQLAALHSPRDLAMVALAEPSRAHEWEWLRWLPHARPTSGFDCQLLVGLDQATVSLRLSELLALIDARRSAVQHNRATVHRSMVVFIEGRHGQRAIADLLTHGPAVGVYAICIVDHANLLPAQCAAVATVANASSTQISLRTSAAAPVVGTLDAVSPLWIEHLARALAPLRDAAPRRDEALPDTVRWLELAEMSEDITPDIVARWRRRDGSTRMRIGVGLDGAFDLDLARDGPHTLIAGTTGSGKSELLQTMVASLAIASRPDELTFVLIDYKGGAAFGACATLPHTVGIVTDLDGALAERALVSLGAELKRRELLLAGANASHLDAFRATGGRLARLVIVVDEFASLAEELPDFVGGLVGIAQRGRSLGVHLVLATQRPEGVVSGDIRANTNLRICLAVTRESESRDVIDTADAARISRTTPGRGFARTGHGELHPFQAGRVGGATPGIAVGEGIHVQRSPFRSLAEPAMPSLGSSGAAPSGPTDLDRIVLACRTAARQLEIKTSPSPWLEPLRAIETANCTAAARQLTAVLGKLDVPLRQTHEPYLIDLDQVSHIMVAGSARSGRTTAVRTLIAELARSTSIEHLHVYVLDCGGGSLTALSTLPHLGAVATMLEHERVVRLISMLDAELARRQAFLAAHGFGSITEQRSSSTDRLPHIVLAIDGWEAFCALFDDVDNGALVDALWRLLRGGGSAGIHVVVTADRAGLVGRLASTIDHRLVLRQADRADFSLIGLSPRLVPATLPPGRGYLAGSLLETQICLLSSDPSSAGQLAALAEIASKARLRDAALPAHCRPRRVDALPAHIGLGDISPNTSGAAVNATSIVLGLGGDELAPIVVDLHTLRAGFVVAGPPRSGRSSTLATICAGLRASGRHVIAVTPRPSMLADYADECWSPSVSDLTATTHDLPANTSVLVDDAELVMETPVAVVLDRLMRTARDNGHGVIIAGAIEELSVGFRGFVVDARRARAGVVLCPRGPLDGELLGVRLSRGDRSPTTAGRGLLVVGGAAVALQVALPPPLPNFAAYPQTVMAIVPSAVLPALTDTVARPSTAPL